MNSFKLFASFSVISAVFASFSIAATCGKATLARSTYYEGLRYLYPNGENFEAIYSLHENKQEGGLEVVSITASRGDIVTKLGDAEVKEERKMVFSTNLGKAGIPFSIPTDRPNRGIWLSLPIVDRDGKVEMKDVPFAYKYLALGRNYLSEAEFVYEMRRDQSWTNINGKNPLPHTESRGKYTLRISALCFKDYFRKHGYHEDALNK